MAKITTIRNIFVRHHHHVYDKIERVPLKQEVKNDKYWKDCGVVGADVKVGETFTLKRQAKTVVNKFSGNIDKPIALEMYVDFDTGGIGKVIIYVDPSVDTSWDKRLDGKISPSNAAHVIGVSINFDYEEST